MPGSVGENPFFSVTFVRLKFMSLIHSCNLVACLLRYTNQVNDTWQFLRPWFEEYEWSEQIPEGNAEAKSFVVSRKSNQQS